MGAFEIMVVSATMIRVPQGPTPPPVPQPPDIPLDLNFLFQQLSETIGILALIVVGALALRWFFRSPIGEVIAEGIRLRRQRRHGEGAAPDEARMAALEDHVERLQGQIAELAERLDFAERVLTRERAGTRLGPGRPPA